MEEIGERLAILRGTIELGHAADELGVSQATLISYESGDRIPRDSMKLKIANYYRVSVESIFLQKKDTKSDRSIIF